MSLSQKLKKFGKLQPLDEQGHPPPPEHGKFGAIDPKDHIGQEKVSQAPCPNIVRKKRHDILWPPDSIKEGTKYITCPSRPHVNDL